MHAPVAKNNASIYRIFPGMNMSMEPKTARPMIQKSMKSTLALSPMQLVKLSRLVLQ